MKVRATVDQLEMEALARAASLRYWHRRFWFKRVPSVAFLLLVLAACLKVLWGAA